MAKKKIILPRVYESKEGSKFEKHNGKPKISYSQYNSWCEDAYRGSYIGKYFLGIDDPGNVFTEFGSMCGEYLETGEDETKYLDVEDLKWLDTVNKPKGAEYEREVVLDLGNFVTQGFIDQNYNVPDGIVVKDFKTGGEKKVAHYSSEGYQQTTLYCKSLVEEGEKISESFVELLPRKGMKLDKNADHPLRLVGEPIKVPTPYSEERAEDFIKKLTAVVHDISDHYQCYSKFFGDE